MSDEQKPGDPADKVADGAFGGVQSHRAGYGDDLLERLIEYLRLRPTATLASGEGGMLVQHILLLRARIEGMTEAGKVYEKLYSDARAEIDRLHRILATLREHLVKLQAERENVSSQLWDTMNACAGWEQRADRAERILAALREPSKAMLHEMTETWIATPWGANHWQAALRAAVAAAEQEVGG